MAACYLYLILTLLYKKERYYNFISMFGVLRGMCKPELGLIWPYLPVKVSDIALSLLMC